jgi:sodium/bile acid cotransporter 7
MLASLAERWFLVTLILGVGLTLLFPDAVHLVTQPLPPHLIIAIALFLMAWTMPTRSLAAELRQPQAAAWAITLSYTATPALAWLVGLLTDAADVRIGMLVSACVPCTLASCVLWTRLAGGNEATALVALLGSTLLSWLATTGWLSALTGTQVELDVPRMMLDLVTTLVIPVALGQGLRALPRLTVYVDRHRLLIGNVAQLCVLSIILKTTAAVGLQLHAGTTQLSAATVIASVLLTQAVHIAALALGWWTSLGWIDRPRRLAVAFASSQKTLPVALFLFERYYREAFPLAVLPLLCYHVGQLIVDTFIAERLRHSSPSPPYGERGQG